MKAVAIKDVSDAAADAIVRRDLQKVVDKMIRKAHKAGSRGREVYAEHSFTGSLLDASIQLADEFESLARACEQPQNRSRAPLLPVRALLLFWGCSMVPSDIQSHGTRRRSGGA